MKKSILIADSGGTSTEWCFVSSDGERTYFSGNSYHPMHWGEDFLHHEQVFWRERQHLIGDVCLFFGAGCLAEEKATKMKEILLLLGLKEVEVKSDLHGAGYALYGKKEGCFAILGTGSVAAHFNNGEILEVKGGLGYILGDEGSAFSFGRLLIKLLLEERLSPSLAEEIHSQIGTRAEIVAKVYTPAGRNFVANLASLFGPSDNQEIQFIHELNLSTFLNSIERLGGINRGIALVGSYGFHQRHLIKELLIGKQIPLINAIQSPIEQITDYFVNPTE